MRVGLEFNCQLLYTTAIQSGSLSLHSLSSPNDTCLDRFNLSPRTKQTSCHEKVTLERCERSIVWQRAPEQSNV